jgi:uncharacterized membrane protein
MAAAIDPRLHRTACAALVALIALCVAWELWLSPLRPGGSWLVLKMVPLLLVLRGVLRGTNYALQWSVLIVWIYVTEGLVRATSESGLSMQLGIAEVALSFIFFACCTAILRPQKQLARQQKGEQP